MLKIQRVLKESVTLTGKNAQAPLGNITFAMWVLGIFSEIFKNLSFLAFPHTLTAILHSIQSYLLALYCTGTGIKCNIHVSHTHTHTNCEVKAIKMTENTCLGLWNTWYIFCLHMLRKTQLPSMRDQVVCQSSMKPVDGLAVKFQNQPIISENIRLCPKCMYLASVCPLQKNIAKWWLAIAFGHCLLQLKFPDIRLLCLW